MNNRLLGILALLTILLSACVSPSPRVVPTPTYLPSFSLDYFANRPVEMAGALALSVENLKQGCNEFGKPAQIKFTFRNLQDSSLILYKRIQLSVNPMAIAGYISAQIQNSSGTVINYGPIDPGRNRLFANPDDFMTIQPESDFESSIEYYFPQKNEYSTPLPPDQYVVSFIYYNMYPGPNDPSDIQKFFDKGAWMGKVESNQIEICMTDQ